MSNLASNTDSDVPALVVFGLDDAGRAHGSFFIESEAALATKAAALMGMKLLPVKTEADRALAERLPKGRVFPSGRAFLPFAKAALHAELEAAVSHTAPAAEQRPPKRDDREDDAARLSLNAPPSEQLDLAPVPQPTDWNNIRIGAIVLAAAPTDAGWYECQILSVEGDGHFTLRYCEWPNEPIFSAQLPDVALLHPARTPERPLTLEQAASLSA